MTESNKGRFKCADDAQAAWAIYADRWANKTSQPARPSEQHDELANAASTAQQAAYREDGREQLRLRELLAVK